MARNHRTAQSSRSAEPRARTKRVALYAAVGLAGLAILAGEAPAQSVPGDFAPGNSWWLHPQSGTLGVSTDGSTISIDRDGDGATDADFDTPAGLPAGLNLRLTPSRERLIAFGGSCLTTGTQVYVYEVPAPPDPLVAVRENHCIADGIDQQGYYDTGLCTFNGTGLVCNGLGISNRRVAYYVHPGATEGSFRITWIDLDSGTVSTSANFDYDSSLDGITIAPSGSHALVKHGVPSQDGADYRVIDLCPFSMGTILNYGGFPLLDQPGDPAGSNLVGRIAGPTSGVITIQIDTQAGDTLTSLQVVDCIRFVGACCYYGGTCNANLIESECAPVSGEYLGIDTVCEACPPPPPSGACCAPGGFSCFDSPTAQCEAYEGYTAQGDDTSCTVDGCPMVDLVLDIGAPESATMGVPFTVTLDYQNAGDLASEGAELAFYAPSGAEVLSVSEGAVEEFGSYTWDLGTLSPGASGRESVVLETGCFVGETLYVGSTNLSDDAGNFASDPDPPTVAIDSLSDTPLVIDLSSSASAQPLRPGDVLTHSLTFTNPLDRPRDGLLLATPESGYSGYFPGISAGDGMEFGRVLSDGGGSVVTTTTNLDWQGTVPASSSVTIEFTTFLPECVPALAGAFSETQLNYGEDIALFDECDENAGQTTASAPFAVEKDTVNVAFEALGLGPPAELITAVARDTVQLTRPGTSVQYQVRLSSNTGEPVSNASIEIAITGADLAVTPLVPPTDPGAVPSGDSVFWSGTVPATGEVPFTVAFALDACRASIEVEGSSRGDDCIDIGKRGHVAGVPEPPPVDHLVALAYGLAPGSGFSSEQHVVTYTPGDDAYQTELCLPGEFVSFLGAGTDGKRWVGLLPTYFYDPATLEFSGIDFRRLTDAGLGSVEDAAPAPGGDLVYFLGSNVDEIDGTRGALLPYHPLTDTLGAVLRIEDLSYVGRGVVGPDGDVVAVAQETGSFGGNMIARVTPQGVSTIVETSLVNPLDVDLDGVSHILSTEGAFVSTYPLIEVSPAGVETVIVPDLSDLFGTFQPFGAIAAGPNGTIYLAAGGQEGLVSIDPDASPALARGATASATGDVLVAFDSSFPNALVSDMHFTPEPGNGSMGVGALLALAALRARGRRRR